MSIKEIINEAEEQIEAILGELEADHGIRAFKLQVLSNDSDGPVEIKIIKDERY